MGDDYFGNLNTFHLNGPTYPSEGLSSSKTTGSQNVSGSDSPQGVDSVKQSALSTISDIKANLSSDHQVLDTLCPQKGSKAAKALEQSRQTSTGQLPPGAEKSLLDENLFVDGSKKSGIKPATAYSDTVYGFGNFLASNSDNHSRSYMRGHGLRVAWLDTWHYNTLDLSSKVSSISSTVYDLLQTHPEAFNNADTDTIKNLLQELGDIPSPETKFQVKGDPVQAVNKTKDFLDNTNHLLDLLTKELDKVH
jgi:hypothetical protein